MAGVGLLLASAIFLGDTLTTFIDLVNKVCARLNEVPLTTGNFNSALGFYQQAKEAVNTSIRDILRRYQTWPFIYRRASIVLVPGQANYDYSASTGNVVGWDSWQVNRNDGLLVSQQSLVNVDYLQYLQYIYVNDIQAQPDQWGIPQRVSEGRTGKDVWISPFPDKAYTVSYDLWEMPADLVAATDNCVIPSQFDALIIDGAMVYAQAFRENVELIQITSPQFELRVKEMVRQAIGSDPYMKSTQITRPYPVIGPTRRW